MADEREIKIRELAQPVMVEVQVPVDSTIQPWFVGWRKLIDVFEERGYTLLAATMTIDDETDSYLFQGHGEDA